MKLPSSYFIFFITSLFISCNTKKELPSVQKYSWLNGNWFMKEDAGVISEEWKIINDSLMEGKAAIVKNDSIIPFETIRIYRNDTLFFYEATSVNQNNQKPVLFKLQDMPPIGFIALNYQHDFPKRIGYQLINKDSIHAFIDDGYSTSKNRNDFYYSRIK